MLVTRQKHWESEVAVAHHIASANGTNSLVILHSYLATLQILLRLIARHKQLAVLSASLRAKQTGAASLCQMIS